jgi:hypothetical protein
MGAEKTCSHRDSIPERPARDESLYRLCYPGLWERQGVELHLHKLPRLIVDFIANIYIISQHFLTETGETEVCSVENSSEPDWESNQWPPDYEAALKKIDRALNYLIYIWEVQIHILVGTAPVLSGVLRNLSQFFKATTVSFQIHWNYLFTVRPFSRRYVLAATLCINKWHILPITSAANTNGTHVQYASFYTGFSKRNLPCFGRTSLR